MTSTIEIGGEKYQYTANTPYKDPDLLQKLYWEEGMTQCEIAELCGCSQKTISRWMDRLGVSVIPSTRERVPHFRTHQGYERWDHTYGENRHTVSVHRLLAVAEFGVSEVKNKEVHHKNGVPWDNRVENIKTTTKSEHAKEHREEEHHDSPWRDEDRLRELYCEKEMSQVEIAEKWGCSTSTVYKWLEKLGIGSRSHSKAAHLRDDNE